MKFKILYLTTLFALSVLSSGCGQSRDKIIHNFPEIVPAIGPYSHVCETDGFVFLSGQIALDSKGNLISDKIEEQSRFIFENISKILTKLGLNYASIIKVTVYMTDLSKFKAVNEIYSEYITKDYPARTTVGVKELPKGAQIEIDITCKR
ncbi:MAG: hypothetical protein HY606_13080 [Planctomycetes bacterium]|nr:hypothetical protein [Planctomycetota bacterium]